VTHYPPIVDRHLYAGCLSGQLPAEALSTADRDRLVRLLHRRGWTDTQIAVHTSMTTYTTVRIRSRLGLSPNDAQKGAA
jgi:hypothetical protein